MPSFRATSQLSQRRLLQCKGAVLTSVTEAPRLLGPDMQGLGFRAVAST